MATAKKNNVKKLAESTQPQSLEFVREQMTKTLGDSGTSRYGGYFQEEKNAEWRDTARITNVEEMRNTDGAIKAMLNAIKSPIVSANWSIFTYDSTPKGEEIRAFVERDVFNMCDRSWMDFLREALAYLDFGFYPFELIWEIRNGEVHLKDLSPRIPASVLRWKGPNNVPGIVQQLRTDDTTNTGIGMMPFIPMDKLFVLTNDKEGDDITGRSVLRSAYLHFKMKNVAYRVGGISIDRYGVGIPTVTLPENFGDADKDAAEEMAENVRSSEKGYMVLPHGWQFEIKTPAGNPVATQIDSLVAHHNNMMLMSVLAQFLNLGSGDTGSWALSSDQSSFFLQHCQEKADYFAAQFTRQVIRRIVDTNFGPQEWYPELRHTPLGNKDMAGMANILNTLSMAGFLEPTPEMKQWTREAFKLPEMQDDEVQDDEEDKAEAADGDDEIEDQEMGTKNNGVIKLSTTFKPFRKLTEQEQRIDLQTLSEEMDSSENSLQDEMAQLTRTEIDRYVAAVQKKIDAGDIVGIASMSFMLFGPVKAAVAKAIKQSYEDGKTSAVKELKIERPSTPKIDQQVMSMDADDIAQAYQFELEQKSKETIKAALMGGAATVAIAVAVKKAARESAAKMITNIGGTVVGQYVNRGRTGVFQKNLTDIQSFQRSEVLDEVTCDTCISLDGTVLKPDDPMAQMDIVHTNCRGIWVPIFEEDDVQPDVTGMPKKLRDSFDTVDGRPQVNAYKQLKKPIGAVSAKAQNVVNRKMGQ